jgi:hypothetical protein
MTIFYQFLFLGITSFGMGVWFLYSAKKNPFKKKKPYNLNVMQYINSFGLMILGLIMLISLFFV